MVCAALGGYIYAIGGNDHGVRFSSVERYDPSRDQWVEVASMLSPRSGCGVGVVDGFIYVVGGYDGSQYLSTSERYSFASFFLTGWGVSFYSMSKNRLF